MLCQMSWPCEQRWTNDPDKRLATLDSNTTAVLLELSKVFSGTKTCPKVSHFTHFTFQNTKYVDMHTHSVLCVVSRQKVLLLDMSLKVGMRTGSALPGARSDRESNRVWDGFHITFQTRSGLGWSRIKRVKPILFIFSINIFMFLPVTCWCIFSSVVKYINLDIHLN